MVTINDLFDVTLLEILKEYAVTVEQYENALGCVGEKVCVLFKRKLWEVNIWPYNTVILTLLPCKMFKVCLTILGLHALKS